ncbi:MAG TPA: Stk1 family PASTA domain-containing Ser/Thr kinase [Pseudonocardia sp.]|nr:Stk1 family PASTA domain-containing Ser/Thr kinase [Pseudonocardia sp.]
MVSAEPDLTGALLEGRYQVGDLLAVGGMSRVYRGLDTRLDRQVAIKVMDPRLAADPAFRQRFEREARAVARIDHPGVVDVYDQGEDTGNPARGGEQVEPVVYLVMELVLGGTLRDVLRARGALSVPEALAVLEPVLAGLASAHAQGLAHRDVKPENVLISDTGAVKVADFGLVTAAAQANATSTGMIIGTVAYLSPEQVTGQGIDARSDVYAAGVMLYELLTGVPPYDGEYPVSVAYQHVNKDMPAPSELAPGIPPDVDALVLSATRRDPNARPPDASTLLHAVRGVRASLGIPKVPVPLPAPATTQLTGLTDGSPGQVDSATVPHNLVPPGHAPRPTRALTSLGEWAQPAAGHLGPDAEGGWQEVGADHLSRRRRSRRVLAACVAGIGLLGLIVGIIAWNAGIGYWATVPKLIGMDQGAATQTVQTAGLVPKISQRHDNTIPSGRIAATTPAADAHVAKGSTVELVVSSGRPVVPRISPGTPVTQAQQILRNSDLTPRQDPNAVHSHPTAPPGTVVATSPAAGTELNVGTPVTLVLSTGPRHSRDDDSDSDGDGSDNLRRSIVDRIEDGLRRALGGG